MTKVKVCGITNLEDAQAAADAGADAIGFVFAESPRSVTPEQARDVLRALGPTTCVPVGVFVDEPLPRVVRIARTVGLRVLQLHGAEPPETVTALRKLAFDVVKSFRVSTGDHLAPLGEYEPTAFLLDTFVPGTAGGTGRTFDWRTAVEAKRFGRIILAGGLGVDNVAEAVRVAQPYGVDASSRLETRPGVKDHALVKKFIRLVKSSAGDADSLVEPWPR